MFDTIRAQFARMYFYATTVVGSDFIQVKKTLQLQLMIRSTFSKLFINNTPKI